jgi:hypothetical protein
MPMITKEQIEAKIQEYTSLRNEAANNRDQVIAQVVLYEGAIQDAQYWLNQLNGTAPTPATDVANPAPTETPAPDAPSVPST